MKTLTLYQPWASLVALGVKTVETRSWQPPQSAIGQPVAIHASKRRMRGADALRVMSPNVEAFRAWLDAGYLGDDGEQDLQPSGAVVAIATLRCAVPIVGRGAHHPPSYVRDEPHEGDLPHQQGGLWLIGNNAFTHGTPTRIEGQRPYGDFTPGRWAWFLTDVERLVDPVEVRGWQGLWNWEAPGVTFATVRP